MIQAFDAEQPTLTLSELAQRTKLSAATVRRSLITLEHLGYVRRLDRRFMLAPRC